MARNSCFLCCFGLSPAKNSNKKKKKSWFLFKKSATRKTVSVDTTEKTSRLSNTKKIHTSNYSKFKWFSYKLKGGQRKPEADNDHINKQPPSFNEIPIIVKVPPDHQETRHGSHQNITVESRKSFDHVDGACQRCRKTDAVKTGFIQPGSPDVKRDSGRKAKLSESVSLMDPNREKWVNPTAKQSRRSRHRKHDPVVGLSIVVVTLVILLIWGRACAILCTSAWFYFLPRFASTNENMVKASELESGDPDLNSEEYKKRVVLEGFLMRDNYRAGL